jgi:hypothetical protein
MSPGEQEQGELYYEQIAALVVPTICRSPGIKVQPRSKRITKTKNTSHYWEGGRTRRKWEMRAAVPIFSTPA